MRSFRLVSDRRKSPRMLEAYCDRLYQVYERDRAEAALRFARDEAELRAREARAAMVEARAADKAKSEFLAAMSHELRTPLNAIIGFSDLLGRELGEKGDGKLEEYATDIQGSGEHLLSIINDILDVAKIEVGKLELIECDFDVADIADGAVRLVEGRAREANIDIARNLPCGLPRLYGDERRLKQALLNLLSNAVKFTPPNGRILIEARVNEACDLEILVSDNGIGIDPARIDEVQRPFVQADGELSRSFEGTGLGLYITRSIISAHGGELAIESALGEGTQACLIIPRDRLRGNIAPTATASDKKAADRASTKEPATKKASAKAPQAKKSAQKKPASAGKAATARKKGSRTRKRAAKKKQMPTAKAAKTRAKKSVRKKATKSKKAVKTAPKKAAAIKTAKKREVARKDGAAKSK